MSSWTGRSIAAWALGFALALAAGPIAEAQPRGARQADQAVPRPAAKPITQSFAAQPKWAPKSAEPARREAEAVKSSFEIEGRRVRVDVIKADEAQLPAAGKAPAVLILHGAHGLGDGSLFYPQARALADNGISAFVVHYFDGIPQARKASPQLRREREKVVAEAISHVARQSFVDPDRIGLFGLSLGGFTALSLGSYDPRVRAIVNIVGAMPAEVQREGVHRMPPTLVLHGDRDRTVPVRRAHELADLLGGIGVEHEVKIYRGEGHTFRSEAREDSIERTVAFLAQHLGQNRKRPDRDRGLEIALADVPTPQAPPVRQFTIADEALGLDAE